MMCCHENMADMGQYGQGKLACATETQHIQKVLFYYWISVINAVPVLQ